MVCHRKSSSHRALFLSIAILAALAAAPPAWSCSLGPGPPQPTNYDIVREAQVIVLAKAVAEETHSRMIRFEVEEVLKGDFPPSTVALYGNLDFRGRRPEGDFRGARPGAYAGGCQAFDYRLKQHYVLFLGRSELDEEWAVSGPAFGRLNEEVDVPDSAWLQAVRHYLRVARLHDYDREKLALQELRTKAAAGTTPRSIPRGLVRDIDRHFVTASAGKSPADLIDLYKRSGYDAARLKALWGLATIAPPAAKDLLRGQLLKETRPAWLDPLGRYFSRVQDHEILGPLAQNWDRLPSISWIRQVLLDALAKAAGRSDAPIMTGLLRKTANDEQASILARWITAQGLDTRSAIDFLHSRLADTPGDFTRYQKALAILGDPAVVAWATQRIWSDSKLQDWEYWGSHGAIALASSPLPEADAAVRKIIKSGDVTRIEWLGSAYLEATGNPKRWDRLADILRSQPTNAHLLDELKSRLFFLRQYSTGDDRLAANRLFERARKAVADLPKRPPQSL